MDHLPKLLNPSGLPGEVIDLNCLNDIILPIRCCLSDQVAKQALRRRYGIDCSDKTLESLRFKQILLNYIMCVDYNKLTQECLEESELVDIINYLKLNCTKCTDC